MRVVEVEEDWELAQAGRDLNEVEPTLGRRIGGYRWHLAKST